MPITTAPMTVMAKSKAERPKSYKRAWPIVVGIWAIIWGVTTIIAAVKVLAIHRYRVWSFVDRYFYT